MHSVRARSPAPRKAGKRGRRWRSAASKCCCPRWTARTRSRGSPGPPERHLPPSQRWQHCRRGCARQRRAATRTCGAQPGAAGASAAAAWGRPRGPLQGSAGARAAAPAASAAKASFLSRSGHQSRRPSANEPSERGPPAPARAISGTDTRPPPPLPPPPPCGSAPPPPPPPMALPPSRCCWLPQHGPVIISSPLSPETMSNSLSRSVPPTAAAAIKEVSPSEGLASPAFAPAFTSMLDVTITARCKGLSRSAASSGVAPEASRAKMSTSSRLSSSSTTDAAPEAAAA
mmetsp:Transcript_136177/g.344833  ORF Transcript_136177/g.344833 Transcript_136177/m.344833 type:complete len:288 (+) Transcript_136177:1487-2350(+)